MVDWPSLLWPVSYRGVPFFIERDTESGGRRIAVHEFWRRDDPFLEDGGASPVRYEVTAYVANDAVTASLAAVMAALRAEGPALLVRPLEGPVLARCVESKRDHERDRMGYVAIQATFVREGASVGLVSLGSLANAIFVAGDTLAAAAGALFATMNLVGLVNRVADETASVFEDAVAGVEVLRGQAPVDATVSATVRDDLAALYADAGALVTKTGADPTGATRLVTASRDLAEGMAAADAVTLFGAQLDDPVVPASFVTMTPTNAAIVENAAVVARVARVANLVAYADSLARATFTSRQEGIAARAIAAERFSAIQYETTSARDEPVLLAAQDLGGKVADLLSRTITTLAPVVTVSAPLTMPALWWAWRLYADPTRVEEMVARNGVRHPAFMPTRFEALAP
jgi:prophage DNA circulation protein